MSNVILACEILEDEIKKAIEESNNKDSIIWIDSSLHMFPQKLHVKLQEEIDRLDRQGNVKNILFTFGYCGNSILGLKSLKSNLIIPQVNDCIEMFLHSNQNKNKIRCQGCYFLTKGWLKSEYSIVNEFERYIEKYGIKRTKRIMDIMLAHYQYLTLINTGAYPMDQYTEIAKEAAQKLDLGLSFQEGSIQLLVNLFKGIWDSDFLVIPPNTEVTLDHFSALELQPTQGQTI
ncbi:MAG: DUF1638 domain-containing protein [Bacillota bacterium]